MHYIKLVSRNKIVSFLARGEWEQALNRWISQYVLLDDDASQAMKARFPLREARIDVAEIPGRPGVYMAIAFLRPHFQLDELSVSLRIATELPTPR
jgi:type VI secretion system protein ImpC